MLGFLQDSRIHPGVGILQESKICEGFRVLKDSRIFPAVGILQESKICQGFRFPKDSRIFPAVGILQESKICQGFRFLRDSRVFTQFLGVQGSQRFIAESGLSSESKSFSGDWKSQGFFEHLVVMQESDIQWRSRILRRSPRAIENRAMRRCTC